MLSKVGGACEGIAATPRPGPLAGRSPKVDSGVVSGYGALGWAVFGLTVAAGLWASHSSLRSVRGPRERVFVRRTCAALWGMVIGFVVAVFHLVPPWNWVAAAVFLVVVPVPVDDAAAVDPRIGRTRTSAGRAGRVIPSTGNVSGEASGQHGGRSTDRAGGWARH